VEPRRARLVAIEGGGPGAPEREGAPRRTDPPLGRREWGLLGLAALLLLALAFAVLRARHLEARVGELAGLEALAAAGPEAEASAP
jgi:hypothetical protein